MPGTKGRAVFVCAHGAGGHKDDRGMLALGQVLAARGVEVVRLNFPYRDNRSGRPDPMPALMECIHVAPMHPPEPSPRISGAAQTFGSRLLSHCVRQEVQLKTIAILAIVGALASPAVFAQDNLAKATFAGGCFWCMEPPYDKLQGVVSTTSGYIGGKTPNPTYEQVSAGSTGHAEAVEIVYDTTKITFEKLLDVFWRNIDPTDASGQFCDKGSQYRSEIFYHNPEQKRLAEHSKAALDKSKPFKGPIVTQIAAATEFYPAEGYHQDYYEKNPVRYKFYRTSCGRDRRLEQLWGS